MTLLDPVERLLFASSRRRFVVTVLAIAFFKTGVWIMPNIGVSQRIALDPFSNPFTNPYQHYLYWNWLSPFLAWSVGATGNRGFILFHLAFAIAFTSLLVVTLFRRLDDRNARIALLVFSMLPVSQTAYYWIGMDAVVLFLMLLALGFRTSAWMPLVVGVALGMQHFEQGLVAGVALLVATLVAARMRIAPPYPLRFSGAWIVGTIVGKSVLVALFAHWHVVVNDGRLTLFGHEFRTLLFEGAFNFQVIAWSMLGGGWLFLLGYVDRLRREAVPLLAGLLVCLPFLVLAQDETRVLAIITLPLIVGHWLYDEGVIARVTSRDASFLFVAWLVLPWSWTWLGIPRPSALPFDVYRVLNHVFGPFPADALDAVKWFE